MATGYAGRPVGRRIRQNSNSRNPQHTDRQSVMKPHQTKSTHSRSQLRSQLRQIPLNYWPKGQREVAFTIKGEPDRIARTLSIKFEHDCDNLDDFEAAIIRLPQTGHTKNPGIVVFQHYPDSPSGGVHVIPDDVSSPNLRRIAELLNLTRQEVQWVQPELKSSFDLALGNRWRLMSRIRESRFVRNSLTGRIRALGASRH
jgi:hypothetical protein